jgi:predicted nucleic acid-binding protein
MKPLTRLLLRSVCACLPSPVNYLILIGHIDLLPRMFERVALPRAVQAELSSPRAPLPVNIGSSRL